MHVYVCVCTIYLQPRGGPSCWGWSFELSCWLIWGAQLNNTSMHTGGPLLYLQGSGGKRLSVTILYPREASACWALDRCTWPPQLGLVMRGTKTMHGPHHKKQLSISASFIWAGVFRESLCFPPWWFFCPHSSGPEVGYNFSPYRSTD